MKPDQTGLSTAMAGVVLASVTVLLSVGAANAALWSFSPWNLAVSVVALAFGLGVIALVRWRGGSVQAGAVAAMVGVLLMVGSGQALAPLGPWIPLAVVGVTGLAYWVVNRLRRSFDFGWLVQWLVLGLGLINGVFLAQILMGEIQRPDPSPITVDTGASGRPDVVVLILDEFASLESAPLDPDDEVTLLSLEESGFRVHPTVWAPYTVSSAAIPAILDGGYPLENGEVIDDMALARLGEISRGGNRLVESLKSVGYRLTMIESGLWLTSCGPNVDVCVSAHPLDEMTGILLERSAFTEWYQRIWGHSFIASGLHAMAATRQELLASGGNGQADLIVAHVMLPHVPYLLDDGCQRHQADRYGSGSVAERLRGYQRQAGCVVDWLVDTLAAMDRHHSPRPVVAVIGDHGTNLSGQLSKPLDDWSDAEAAERLAAFAAVRMPPGCDSGEVSATPQVIDVLIGCMTGASSHLDPHHFLSSYGSDTVEVVEYPSSLLDTGISVADGAKS